MNEEKFFPIYKIGARWNQDDYQNNGSGFTIMYPEDPGINFVRQEAMKYWEQLAASKKLAHKHPELISLNVRFFERETWCLTWFSHYTFNTHLDDAALLASFERFVRRKQDLNVSNGHLPNDIEEGATGPFYCLMGAEDRWRWEGPCRCDDCTKQGKVTMQH